MAELPFKVKAVYSYDSPHEDDLNFPTGQIITVTEEEDNDWYYGEYVDESGLTKQGIFPRNFVERLQPDAPPRPMKSHRARKTVDLDASTIQESSKPDKSQEEHPPPDEPSPQTGMSVLGRQISHRAPTDTEQGPASLSQPQPLSRANTDGPSKPESSHSPTQAPSIPSKAVPSPPVDKPIAGSFRDRIAAFNKPAAPPITPLKPASLGQGGASFVKKPYVPPPPSRHAYIPPPRETPQKKYRREEEDIEAEAPTWSQVQTAEITSQAQDGAAQEKPTSLKERIALLQQQQLENAVRRSEAAQKGDAGRRPSKQRTDSFRDEDITEPGSSKVESSRGVELGDDSSAVEAAPGASLTGPTIEPKASHAASNVGAHDFTSDANDADQSGFDEIAEDAEGNSTEQDDTNDRAIAGTAPYRSLVHPAPAPPDTETSEEQSRHENGDGDQEDEDVDIDPEIRRRMELRERMAKMSGGMGMHGMFGMPGGIPRTPLGGGSKKEREKAGGTSGERESVEGSRTERDDRGGPAPQGQPIPALPPLPRSQSFGVKERTSASPVEIGRETLVHERPSHDDHIEAGRGLSTQTESSEQPAPGIPDYRKPGSLGCIRELADNSEGAPHSVEPSDDDDMSPQSHPSASLRSDEAAVVEPSAALSPSAGSESDDEMSLRMETVPVWDQDD
ncbi:MAG: hypothetical protein M1816_000016 [Peltula sp. TS41687]|nr:MAG: hypothetical protein M1816_000016 [Peltula sp. TS41687]